MDNTTIYYIIEHFEDEVSEWTLKEYIHMIMMLSGLYYEVKG
jgi:ribosome biogenesis SPOUT family RNA methylase Rps3